MAREIFMEEEDEQQKKGIFDSVSHLDDSALLLAGGPIADHNA
jgi:hypothetical protein